MRCEPNSDFLELHILNDFDPESVKPKGEGIGLKKNIRKRMQLIYQRTDLLEIRRGKIEFEVILRIPITKKSQKIVKFVPQKKPPMKAAIRTLIIEDEAPARMLLQRFLADHPAIEVIGECADGFSGLKAINDNKPDLLILDIQMPKLTGFELLELLDVNVPEIIFTTAYDQFASKLLK